VKQIGGNSPPVGLFEDARYINETLEVPGTFALRVYSDGVLELLAPGDLAGKKEVLRDISQNVDLDAEDLAQKLGLDGHARRPDDATVLSVRRLYGHA
jgi:serine phosphatase RsbU (regulator of sigma subunit)